MRIRLHQKSKSDNYPKSPKVNRADIRCKEYVHNCRGLAGELKRAVTTNCEKCKPPVTPVLYKSLAPTWYEFGRVGHEKALFIYIFPIEGQ